MRHDGLPQVDGDPSIDWANVEASLIEAKRWMNAPQPDGAIMSHHGRGVYVGRGTRLAFAPNGSLKDGMTREERQSSAVIILDRETEHYEHGPVDEETGRYPPPYAVTVVPPLSKDEHDRIDKMIRKHFKVVDRWNVNSPGTGSWCVEASPTGAATAVSNYFKGCSVPGHSVFCGGWQAHTDEQKACKWREGFKLLAEPAFVNSDHMQPGMPEPAAPVRNAELVATTIAEVSSILAELGIHPKTLHAGALGSIEGEPGDREFVQADQMALGVALPAESFRELVRLAVLAKEMENN